MINNITKTAYEKFPIYADFSHDITAYDSILSQTLTCVNILTGVDTKATIIDSHSVSLDRILIIIKAGTINESHHITSKIITAVGTESECDIFLSIADLTTGSFKKQPSEKFNILFDFDNRIDSPRTIGSVITTATKISDGSDVTSTVIISSTINNNTVIVGIKAGTNDESYLISSKIVTDVDAYQLENIVRMDIIER